MEEPVRVDVLQSDSQLVHDVPDLLFGELVVLFSASSDDLAKVCFADLEDHVDCVLVSDDLFHLHYGRVVQLNQSLDLSQGHRFFPRPVLLHHLLYRHHLPRVLIDSLVNASKGPRPQSF